MKYVSNPNVTIKQNEGKVSFHKTFIPSEVLVLDEISLTLYVACQSPKALEVLSEINGFDSSNFEKMVNHSIICKEDELSYLLNGLLTPPQNPISKYYSWDDFQKVDTSPNSFVFFGVPTDSYGTKGGSRFGSMLIRKAMKRPVRKFKQAEENKSYVYDFELRRKIDPTGLQILDVGDIFCHPQESQKELSLKIGKVVRSAVDKGFVPIMLGGDHSLTFHSANVLGDIFPEFGIIHFDAHHDIYVNSVPQQQSLNHGNAFAHLLKRKELKQLRQIGLRTFDFLSEYSEKTRDERVSYFSSFEIQQMLPEEVFKGLANIPYYLSFDIDCLSPNVTSDTGTPVVGGLTYYQALSLIDYASSNFNIIGYDFVEVSDNSLNNLNFGGEIMARLISTCLLTDKVHLRIS